jgi:hypothetical protein
VSFHEAMSLSLTARAADWYIANSSVLKGALASVVQRWRAMLALTVSGSILSASSFFAMAAFQTAASPGKIYRGGQSQHSEKGVYAEEHEGSEIG